MIVSSTDGAIGHFDTIRRYLGRRFADIPVVIMNNSYRKYRAPSPTVRIVAADDAIGKAAADLFVKRGLRHLAFVSDISQVVSESLHHAERMESFRKAALAAVDGLSRRLASSYGSMQGRR